MILHSGLKHRISSFASVGTAAGMHFSRLFYIGGVMLLLCAIVSSCKKNPDNVLDREEMAQLMADIHTAEAVIDFNYSAFPNDSTRKMLKQSVYEAHGVSAETVDTSFVWYGNHIEEYIKVYDRTIELLHQRQSDYASANSAQIAIAGDSVAVWRGPERVLVSTEMPSRIITFSVSPDSTWRAGDIYTLMYKPVNAQSDIEARLLVDYMGGLTHYANRSSTTRFPNQRQIQVDSTQTPIRVYGYLVMKPEPNVAFEVDSIVLTRQRKDLIPAYRNRAEVFSISDATDEEPDSTEVNSDIPSSDIKSARRQPSTQRHRPMAESVDAPESSTAESEHRQGAAQHKPTATQRREARQRQRSAQPVQKSTQTPAKARTIKKAQ